MSIFGRFPMEVFFVCLLSLSLVDAHFLEHLMHQLHPHPTKSSPTCKPNCCQGKKCPKPKCHPHQMLKPKAGSCGCCPKCMTQLKVPETQVPPHQMLKPKAGLCGCCPKCMTQLKMGASCHPKPKHPCPHMPSSECGCGMKCVHGKCCKK